MFDFLDFAIDSVEFTMYLNSLTRIGILIIIALLIVKLIISIVQQLINLFKK